MDYKSLPELDTVDELYKYQLQQEAERLNIHISSNATKDEVEDMMEPYMDKKKYREQRSLKFCKDHGLKPRTDLNSTQRRKIQRILDGTTVYEDEYNRSSLPYNVKLQ